MAINNVTFTKGAGGLGRPLAGKDHYSGYLYYKDSITLPGSWDTSGFEQVFSVSDFESKGLTAGWDSVAHYQASEFFRMNPQGILYVGLVGATSGTYDFGEVIDLSDYAEGQMRQCLVYAPTASTTTLASALQTQANTLETNYRPCSFILDGTNNTYSDLTALPDLITNGQNYVSVTVGTDRTLNVARGATVSSAGTLLGVISAAAVHENVGWVNEFNIQSGTDFADPYLMTGEQLKNVTDNQLEAIQNKGYIPIRTFTDFSGVYFLDSDTTDLSTSDYKYIENNRTIDKAIRNVRISLLPDLNSPLVLNDDGTLTEGTLNYFIDKAETPLQLMENDGELSAFQVLIDPDQDVLATSVLNVTINLVPVGVARTISVTIGFTTSVA